MRLRVEELFREVADLSVEGRSRYFAEHNVDGPTRVEVEALVAFDSTCNTDLERDIGQVAERALARFEQEGLRCGPYRLGTLLGRGGMGSVYSAERVDGEVTQSVAVKLLRPGADFRALRRRFLSERQILATLSHPNIARLLDAGHREDGQPYLVMEYVEGQTIDAFAAGLSVRQRVALLVKVCGAVSYLHRNLVVHRDLKPSNILVTEQGEPKLLDFGIAKMLDLAGDATVTAMRMLTPHYASPEQVSGGPITTATDIYSLGAVLYKLLTGISPHRSDGDSAGAMEFAASGGRITPPSKLTPSLKGDLELILMKALRREPRERYASVEQFCEDLENYLGSRPIRARKGDAWYRTRKFLRRHWLPAAAAIVTVAGLTAGLLVANRERTVAERRFGQLRQLSNRLLDLDAAIRLLPGSVEARQRLVAASLEYLEGLSREAHGNVELAREIALGYARLARIQGVNAEFNLGDSAKAEESLKQAEKLIGFVLSVHPHDRPALWRAAIISHDRMLTAFSEDRRADVLIHARKSVERLEAYLPANGLQNPARLIDAGAAGSPQSERNKSALVYINLATTFDAMGLHSDGVRYARLAAGLAETVGSAGLAMSVLADALRHDGDLDAALAAIRVARKLSERASALNASDGLFGLYGSTLREGLILGQADGLNLGRPAEAIEILQKTLDIAEAAAQKDANDSASRTREGLAAWGLGDILRDRDPLRALAVYDQGIRRLEEAPRGVEGRRYRAMLLTGSSYSLRRLHRTAEAKARIDAAVAILKEMKLYPAEQIHLDSPVKAVVSALADYEAETGNPGHALEIYEQLLEKVCSWPAEPDTSLPAAVSLSRLYGVISGLDHRVGRNSAAAVLEARRLELWRHWSARLSNNRFVRHQLDAANHGP